MMKLFSSSLCLLLILRLTTSGNPNIAIIYIDDLRFTADMSHSSPIGVNLNGHTISYLDLPTPNIDAFLDDSGIIFPRSYSGGTKCVPSRYTIITGRYPSRSVWARQQTKDPKTQGTDITGTKAKIYGDDEIYNIQTTLKNNGYYTGFVGKYHLLTTPSDNDYNYGCKDIAFTPDAALYDKCKAITAESGYDEVDAWYYGNINNKMAYGHNPEWMVYRSQKIIDNALSASKPFYLFFSSTLTHGSLSSGLAIEGLKKYSNLETPKGILTGDERPLKKKTGMAKRRDILNNVKSIGAQKGWSIATDPDEMEQLAGTVWLDEQIGALLQYFKDKNVYDNTMIFILSDHGMGAKGLLYEQGLRTIQFLRYPALYGVGNTRYILPNTFITSQVDIGATIFDICGITPDSNYVIDGISWYQDVDNTINGIPPNPQTCCQYKYGDSFNSHTIVTKDYKYIYRATQKWSPRDNVDGFYLDLTDSQQFYDLNADPEEQYNQFSNPSFVNQIYEMQTRIIEYRNGPNGVCPSLPDLCDVPNLISLPPSAQQEISKQLQIESNLQYKNVWMYGLAIIVFIFIIFAILFKNNRFSQYKNVDDINSMTPLLPNNKV